MAITEYDWDELFSGDAARVRAAVERLRLAGKTEQLMEIRKLNPRFLPGDLADVLGWIREETFGDFAADEFHEVILRMKWLVSLNLLIRKSSSLPTFIHEFPRLKHLGLEAPHVSHVGLSWEGAPYLESLTISNSSILQSVEIDLSQHESLVELGIFCCDLREIPPGLHQLINLNFYRNPNLYLNSWPEYAFERLVSLNLSNTLVSFLPDVAGYFSKIETIRLESTPMKALPAAISTWGNQLELFASGSKILELPESLQTASNIKSLHLAYTPYAKIILNEGPLTPQERKARPSMVELHKQLKDRFEIYLH